MPDVPELNDIVLDFSEVEALEEFEVTCRSVSMRRANEIDALPFTERMQVMGDELIKSWNFTKDGAVLIVNGDQLAGMPAWIGMTMYNAWTLGLVTAPKALGTPASNGR